MYFRGDQWLPKSFPGRLHQLAVRLLGVAMSSDIIALKRVITAEVRHFPDLALSVYHNGTERIAKRMMDVLQQSGRSRGCTSADLRRDAEIFLGLVILPPQRRALLSGESTRAVDPDHLERSIDIFAAGWEAHGLAKERSTDR